MTEEYIALKTALQDIFLKEAKQNIALLAALHHIGWCSDTRAYEIQQSDGWVDILDTANEYCSTIDVEPISIEQVYEYFNTCVEELQEEESV